LIAYAPHPDDAELFCGGTLSKMSSAGYGAGVVDLTEGERGTRGSPETRSKEREKASKTLGLALREGLGLPDMGLAGTDRGQLEAVVASLRQHRPRLVLAPHWEDRHPDHVEGSKLVTSAFFLAGAAKFGEGAPFKPSAIIYYQGSQEFAPSLIVDISGQFEAKMKAIECYSSQFSPRSGDEPETDIAHPHFLERVRSRARHYGLLIGAEYGEPFLVKGPVGVSDPVGLLVERK
jgi:bacillithiol biosynthesis deacetylase BshB1